jgi:hypothetical protein
VQQVSAQLEEQPQEELSPQAQQVSLQLEQPVQLALAPPQVSSAQLLQQLLSLLFRQPPPLPPAFLLPLALESFCGLSPPHPRE